MSLRQTATIFVIAVAALYVPSAAHAETDLLLMGKSWHFGHDVPPGQAGYGVNQYNWGVGLEYRFDGTWWFAGALTYRDTFRQQAYAVYGGYQATIKLSTSVSAFAAVRAGYLNGSGWHGPGILPSIGLTYSRASLEATYIPPARNGYNCIAVFGRVSF
ncbi:hypothetical protein [Paraburkholderia bannensis]|uniref:hypothetical protein n=1 Tax=Paraburkholderia bannensis TaxID=765414 RepID=UPI0038BAC3DB